jgi:hypothetical protein
VELVYSLFYTCALDGGLSINLNVSMTASEIGLPLCGGFAYSLFLMWTTS